MLCLLAPSLMSLLYQKRRRGDKCRAFVSGCGHPGRVTLPALHLSALLSSGVVLLGAHCGCGVPCARTPPVLRFSNQHRRLSHRHSSSFRRRVLYTRKSSAWARPRSSSVRCRACYRSPAHLQPSFNRQINHFPTIFLSPSNHHPHAPRPSLLPSAATRQDILIIPPTPLQDALQPCPNTEKAGGPKPARPGARETRAAAAYSTTSLIGTLSVSESTSGSMFVRLKLSSASYSPASSGACSIVTTAEPPVMAPNAAG